MLPVAELHIHIEGALEPELLVKLARRNGTWMPTLDVDELRAQYRFDGLRSFLDLHYANMRVLKIEPDFYDLARGYLARAAAAGVRRAEIFFDPQTHLANGVPLEEVFGGLTAALADGARDHAISADLIPCFQRDLGADAADAILRACLPFRDQFIGVGLDSTEVGYPPSLFTEVYKLAAAEGLRLVAHAGEEGGPDYVREALDLLGVERVDHGVRSMEDPALVARLRDERIALTVCPLSNVALRVVASLGEHMLPSMLDAGLLATVNSDDPAYFNGYVDDNLAAVRHAFGYDDAQMAALARNSFDACFAPEADKRRWHAEVDAWLAASTARATAH
ncbi:MAG: adenosine deaminase [Streptosporangiaceae bacterium]